MGAKPSSLKKEGYYPICHSCQKSIPPNEWRCKHDRVSKGKLKKDGADRAIGERCLMWVSERKGDYCGLHKKYIERNKHTNTETL